MITETGNENGDGSADDAVSMASERSRSRSRSRSSERNEISIRDELASAASKAPAPVRDREINTESASNDKVNTDGNDKHETVNRPNDEDEEIVLSQYDIEMKRLESHTERITRPSDIQRTESDTGQTNVQSQPK